MARKKNKPPRTRAATDVRLPAKEKFVLALYRAAGREWQIAIDRMLSAAWIEGTPAARPAFEKRLFGELRRLKAGHLPGSGLEYFAKLGRRLGSQPIGGVR